VVAVGRRIIKARTVNRDSRTRLAMQQQPEGEGKRDPVFQAQSTDTEWIDDPRAYHDDSPPQTEIPAARRLETHSLRERHAQLLQQQALLKQRLDSTEVWDAKTEGYASVIERRLELYYELVLPDGSPRPDVHKAVVHFAGDVGALNQALRAKYGYDLDDAASPERPGRSHTAPRNKSPPRQPGTICQCIADFVDAPASPFAAIGVKSKHFSSRRMHCDKGGVCEPVGEVGRALWEIPGTAVDGLAEGFKHTSVAVGEAVGDGPRMAADGVEASLDVFACRCVMCLCRCTRECLHKCAIPDV